MKSHLHLYIPVRSTIYCQPRCFTRLANYLFFFPIINFTVISIQYLLIGAFLANRKKWRSKYFHSRVTLVHIFINVIIYIVPVFVIFCCKRICFVSKMVVNTTHTPRNKSGFLRLWQFRISTSSIIVTIANCLQNRDFSQITTVCCSAILFEYTIPIKDNFGMFSVRRYIGIYLGIIGDYAVRSKKSFVIQHLITAV